MAAERRQLQPGASQMLYALANKSSMNPVNAFRELIDNSLDAMAKNIAFRYSRAKAQLLIIDDGLGTEDVEAIMTPYRHRDHATTQSGRYGIGGTSALVFLTGGLGLIEVVSRTAKLISMAEADYRSMAKDDVLGASFDSRPNPKGVTGTTITATGVRELNKNHIGSAYRELAFTFAPALRRGVSIAFEVDGKRQVWEAYRAPRLSHRVKIDLDVGGHRVTGFCGIVRPGEPNRVSGWAVEWGHRFVGKFSDPVGDRTVDLGLIYSEIKLPKAWANINDHKDGFVETPAALWSALEEACAPVIGLASQQSQTIELDGATRVAQAILDEAVGWEGPKVKGARGKGEKRGAQTPTGNGSPHERFSKTQPGDKDGRGGLPRRILIEWSSSMEQPYLIRLESGRARFVISKDDPGNDKYRGTAAGAFLAEFALVAIAADWKCRPQQYRSMFPNEEAEEIPELLGRLRTRRRPDAA